MPKRNIIKIDLEKCNGCGNCIPNCPEGALQIIDGKVRLISDLFCDGLGACIGHCPQEAIAVEEREAGEYQERKVMENIVLQGENVIKAHLLHLKEHNQEEYLKQAKEFLKEKNIKVDLGEEKKAHQGCPGSRVIDFGKKKAVLSDVDSSGKAVSELRQWPVQIHLVSPNAPYFKDADILISADCVPFAYADFHRDLLKDKILLVGCPKLDDVDAYGEKIADIIKYNNIKSITYSHMEVPCCFGLINIIESAIAASGKKIPFKEITVTIQGELVK